MRVLEQIVRDDSTVKCRNLFRLRDCKHGRHSLVYLLLRFKALVHDFYPVVDVNAMSAEQRSIRSVVARQFSIHDLVVYCANVCRLFRQLRRLVEDAHVEHCELFESSLRRILRIHRIQRVFYFTFRAAHPFDFV